MGVSPERQMLSDLPPHLSKERSVVLRAARQPSLTVGFGVAGAVLGCSTLGHRKSPFCSD